MAFRPKWLSSEVFWPRLVFGQLVSVKFGRKPLAETLGRNTWPKNSLPELSWTKTDMYKPHITGFWAREPKKLKRARFLASMKEIVNVQPGAK